MSGSIPISTNKYVSIDKTVTQVEGEIPLPFCLARLLDIVRNDGPDTAIIRLDSGDPITLDAGDYIGPWAEFKCSIIAIQTQGTARIRGVGI